jgi:biotin carboxyl carrier protein
VPDEARGPGPTARFPNLQIVSLGDGRYRIIDDDRSRVAFAAAASGSVWIFLEGRVYRVAADRTNGTTEKQRDEHALTAPMPATVSQINVEPGEQVTEGHLMIVLEAMKMELPIRAPRDGRVKAILCRRGELVQPGVRLLDLE